VLALVIGLGAGAAVHVALKGYEAPGPFAASRAVVIPRGSPAQVAETLQAAGVIEHTLPFRVAALATAGEGPLHAGELVFPEAASLREVLNVLRTAKPVQHRLTIPEGLTAAQIAALVDKADALTGSAPVPDEGAVLPETYAYEYGATRASLIERGEAAMTRTLARIWASRAPDLPLSSPRELLILASIVERETARPEERAHVASVFLNRLRRGMRLQSDPTVVYAVTGGLGALERGLTRADLDASNPYNTYRTGGLPPGPIGSPGLASLQAVAQPEHSDDLYFVANGSGGHVFAQTLDDHNRNVARWRAGTEPLTR
jgi:UPF0755 protein